MIWVLLAVTAGLSLVSSLLSDQRTKVKASPAEVPDVTPGDPIPVVFGTVRVPCRVVEFDGWRAEAHHHGARPYLFGLVGPKPVVGYWYRVKMVTVVCQGPVDALLDLQFNGKSIANQPPERVFTGFATQGAPGGAGLALPVAQYALVTHDTTFEPYTDAGSYYMQFDGAYTLALNSPNLLGGNDPQSAGGAGGGVAGAVTWRNGAGHATQVPALVAMRAAVADDDRGQTPEWRHVAHLVWDDVQLGSSPNPPAIHAVVRRRAGFTGGDTSGDANCVDVLRELLVSPLAGLGFPAALLDDDDGPGGDSSFGRAWRATARPDPLQAFDADAVMGVSFVLDAKTSAAQVIQDVLRVLDGALYTHPTTGKLALQLFRGPTDPVVGYDPATLPVLDPKVVTGCTWTAPVPAARVSSVRVTYTDRSRNYAQNTVTATNDALVRALGDDVCEDVDYRGVANEALARRLAARDLRALTTPLGRATLVCTRAPAGLVPGGLFRLRWPELQLADRRMRVIDIDGGTLEQPAVTLTAIEDVYGVPGYLATRVVTTPWVNPTPLNGIIRPLVEPEQSQDATTGTLALAIVDPQQRVTRVEFSVQSGYNAAGPFVAVPLVEPYHATVSLSATAESRIAWRVTYADPGAAATSDATGTTPAGSSTIDGIEVFTPMRTLAAPTVAWHFTALAALAARVTAPGVPSDVAGIRVLALVDVPPTETQLRTAALQAVTPGAVVDYTPLQQPAAGQTLYLAAAAYAADGFASARVDLTYVAGENLGPGDQQPPLVRDLFDDPLPDGSAHLLTNGWAVDPDSPVGTGEGMVVNWGMTGAYPTYAPLGNSAAWATTEMLPCGSAKGCGIRKTYTGLPPNRRLNVYCEAWVVPVSGTSFLAAVGATGAPDTGDSDSTSSPAGRILALSTSTDATGTCTVELSVSGLSPACVPPTSGRTLLEFTAYFHNLRIYAAPAGSGGTGGSPPVANLLAPDASPLTAPDDSPLTVPT
ncbi:hypothetical protein tb265_39120 [Gemmatimonadetes bacterium T265]|nr:hypothetical protein tb265_39120 [Gemmatimonadetes bacterium T265]